ncbi:MAG: 50S ribosomal protein L5 [Phycisphaeraceae bacterium]
MTPRMKTKYQSEVAPKVKEQFGIKNPMALPRFDKIVVQVGLGKSLEGTKLNPKHKEQVIKDLTVITGQKPVMTIAKKSVANFKVRAGYENGCRVTLRGDRMWEFFDRLVSLAIPRIKDFRGVKDTSFDGRGNYAFGVNEQGIFPEVDMAAAEYIHGLNVAIVFTNSTDEKSLFLLREMGMPFVRPEETPGHHAPKAS